jgi:hypothetical protein
MENCCLALPIAEYGVRGDGDRARWINNQRVVPRGGSRKDLPRAALTI